MSSSNLLKRGQRVFALVRKGLPIGLEDYFFLLIRELFALISIGRLKHQGDPSITFSTNETTSSVAREAIVASRTDMP